jgi:uncharacterized integral membrane protein
MKIDLTSLILSLLTILPALGIYGITADWISGEWSIPFLFIMVGSIVVGVFFAPEPNYRTDP